ncbi:hypothetical protein [Stappia indica]|uniref:hypothetical protein n=1 Tax=Stappia indica TaxID=538381 RepID=UPI001D18651C|nr:hypothetical protein [Stappia indica]MCC4246211.1 hypothetical protein [Stappia indica]
MGTKYTGYGGDGDIPLSGIHARVTARLGVPAGISPADEIGWLERAAAAERQLGLAGSWAHDPNRLLALRQARALGAALAEANARGSLPPQ